MTDPAAPIPSDPPPAAASALRRRTVVGFAWALVAAAANKGIGLVATLVLARFLTREDFGLVSIALAASAVVLLLRESGVTQVLVQRGDRFDRFAGPALGLVAGLSVFTGLLLAAVARPVAAAYGEPRLVPMLDVIALACPLAGLGNVAVARLEHELRFRELGLIAAGVIVTQYAVYTTLAVLGFGAMSFSWGILLSTAVRLVWLWSLVRPATRGLFDVTAWRGLMADSVWVLGVGLAVAVGTQVDRLVLGKAAGVPVAGVYFFAFNLTGQLSQVLSGTLGGVLLPALARLNERPERQREVFVEMSRLLALVAVPACGLQAVLARPIVGLFGPQWDAAVPLVRVLSVGLAMGVCAAPAAALVQSQGRFRTAFVAQSLLAVACAAGVTVAAVGWPRHAAVAVAVATAAGAAAFGPVGVQLAIGRWDWPWTAAGRVFGPGVLIAGGGLLAAGGVWLIGGGDWPAAGAYAGVAAGVLLAIYRTELRQVVGLARSAFVPSPGTPGED